MPARPPAHNPSKNYQGSHSEEDLPPRPPTVARTSSTSVDPGCPGLSGFSGCVVLTT